MNGFWIQEQETRYQELDQIRQKNLVSQRIWDPKELEEIYYQKYGKFKFEQLTPEDKYNYVAQEYTILAMDCIAWQLDLNYGINRGIHLLKILESLSFLPSSKFYLPHNHLTENLNKMITSFGDQNISYNS